MDGSRFDELTRGLATSSSRRQALKALGGGAAGALLSMLGLHGAAAKAKDKAGKKRDCCPVEAPTLCGRSCVDLDSDPGHCGDCGIACLPGGTCVDGACVAPPCATVADCIPPADPCLVSTCTGGACGIADRCPTEATCTGGSCVCPAGSTYCESHNVCVTDCPPHSPLNPQTCQCDPHFCTSGSAGCANIPCGTSAIGQRCYCQLTIDGTNACIVFPEDCSLAAPCKLDEQCDPGSVCINSDCCPNTPVCLQLCV